MDKRPTKTSKVAAWILWIVNFIVMMVCILTVAFGLWIISSPTTILTVIDAIGSTTMKALLHDMLTLEVGIAMTAIAVFIFFVCFMGFYGAITRSPFLLFMYSALVLLLLLLECALLYYFSSNLEEKGLQDDGQWTHAIRLAFQCCEHNTSIHVNGQTTTKKPPWPVNNQTTTNKPPGPVNNQTTTKTSPGPVNNQTTTNKPPWPVSNQTTTKTSPGPVNNQTTTKTSPGPVNNQTTTKKSPWPVNNQTTTKKPPWSCCGPDAYPNNCTSSQMFKMDCYTSIVSWLDLYQLPIYTSLAVLHVILSSCSFVRRSCHKSRSYS